jgi:hypothetical protein
VDAESCIVTFDHYEDTRDLPSIYSLNPSRLFVTNTDMHVTICAFENRWIPIPSPQLSTRKEWAGREVATISHPRGHAKTLSHGHVSMMTFSGRLFYTAEGDKGCSGGPIFDAKTWTLIGIETGENDMRLPRSVYTLSEGQRVESIMQELAERGYEVD